MHQSEAALGLISTHSIAKGCQLSFQSFWTCVSTFDDEICIGYYFLILLIEPFWYKPFACSFFNSALKLTWTRQYKQHTLLSLELSTLFLFFFQEVESIVKKCLRENFLRSWFNLSQKMISPWVRLGSLWRG